MSRYHVVNDWCGVATGEDFGALDTTEAAQQAIQKLRQGGFREGCRCNSHTNALFVATCEERHRDLKAYHKRSNDMVSHMLGRDAGIYHAGEHHCLDYESPLELSDDEEQV